jgi:hypothetical protein
VKRLNAFGRLLLDLCVITLAFAPSFSFDALPARDWLPVTSLVLFARSR